MTYPPRTLIWAQTWICTMQSSARGLSVHIWFACQTRGSFNFSKISKFFSHPKHHGHQSALPTLHSQGLPVKATIIGGFFLWPFLQFSRHFRLKIHQLAYMYPKGPNLIRLYSQLKSTVKLVLVALKTNILLCCKWVIRQEFLTRPVFLLLIIYNITQKIWNYLQFYLPKTPGNPQESRPGQQERFYPTLQTDAPIVEQTQALGKIHPIFISCVRRPSFL